MDDRERLSRKGFFYPQDIPLKNLVFRKEAGDFIHSVHDGSVIAISKEVADLFKRKFVFSPEKVHGDLAGGNKRFLAAGAGNLTVA